MLFGLFGSLSAADIGTLQRLKDVLDEGTPAKAGMAGIAGLLMRATKCYYARWLGKGQG